MSVEKIKELFSKRTIDAENMNYGIYNNEQPKKTDTIVKNNFDSLTEHDASITEYLNNISGFSGVVKERFSDFQVHEISLDGDVVRLTNFDIPDIPEERIEVNEAILEESTWQQLNDLMQDKITSLEIDVTGFSKDQRREVHKLIKAKYNKSFTTNTVTKNDDGEKKFMVVTSVKDCRDEWPRQCGDYLHFVLFKTNIDTMDAINVIANKLSTKTSNFTYAGTKDKRGKTSQQVCMWHLKPERLSALNKSMKNIKVGNFSYKLKQLKLGDLKGNHFKIALRNVTTDNETIDKALNSLKENGFINYFGLQRFGNSPEVPTFKIGKSLIKGDFKTAVELILKPRDEKMRKDGLEEAKKIWWETKDAKKAIEVLKSKFKSHEGKLLSGLAKHGDNAYVNALDSIPRNVRLLYLHSFQSLLWNKIVSKRMREFGCKVLEGDLINVGNVDGSSHTSKESTNSNNNTAVKYITVDEIDQYNIVDVLHPLPGYNIIYPNNIIKTWYEELLREENLTTEEFKQRVKEYSLSGAYRNIVKNVKDLSWDIVYYSKPEDDLILSDIDLINNDSSTLGSKADGEFKAVVMNFSLDSSTYATMAIREVLKIDISPSYQASLNSYSNDKRKLDDGNGGDDNGKNMRKKIKY